MKPTFFVPVLSLLASSVALIYCRHEFLRLRTLRADLLRLTQAVDELQQQNDLAQGRVTAAVNAQAALRSTLQQAPPVDARDQRAEFTARDSDAESDSVSRNPELRALFLTRFAETVNVTWGPLFSKISLSPDKIEKFKAIEMEYEQNILDLEATMQNQGLEHIDPVYDQMRAKIGVELAQGMKEVLGANPSDLAAYNLYHHEQALVPFVSELATALYTTDSPLTLSQSDQLMQILADASAKRQFGFVIAGTVNWDAALAKAQTILPPTQLALLQTYAMQDSLHKQLSRVSRPIQNP
jgi:hypothetical protein